MYDYKIEDLFDLRNVVGSKLERLLAERTLTKSEVCKKTGLSRPTLDKVLSGGVTSKANFERHLSKLLAFLDMTPNDLMGGIANPFSSAQQLRSVLHLNLQQISRDTGIPVDELKKIEAGENVPLYELRDLAAYLGTGVRGVLGTGFFQTTMTSLEDVLQTDQASLCSPGGLWGHLGILLKGQTRFLWFPVTAYTCSLACDHKDKYMVLACMDNSLLLINCSHILELTLLDDACDAPGDMDWDPDVSCGEFPAVFYEAFPDYLEFRERGCNPRKNDLSEKLAMAINDMVQEKHLDVEAFSDALDTVTIYFSDGTVRTHRLADQEDYGIADTVTEICEMGEPLDTEIVRLQIEDGTNVLVNLQNVAMMQLPLEKIEQAICDGQKAILDEM